MQLTAKYQNTPPDWARKAVAEIKACMECNFDFDLNNDADPMATLINVVNNTLDDMAIFVRNHSFSGATLRREFDKEKRTASIFNSLGTLAVTITLIE